MSLRESLRITVPLLLALFALNIGMAHQNIWPTLWVRPTTELSLELIIFVMGIALVCEVGIEVGRRVQWVVSTFLLLFVIARYIDVTAPALFGRRIDIYWDIQHIPAIAGMVLESWSLFSVTLFLVAIVVILAALLVAGRIALGAIYHATRYRTFRRTIMATAALSLVAYGVGMNSEALKWEQRFSIPITPVYLEQANAIAGRAAGKVNETLLPTAPLRPYAELNGNDVFVIFLESYGRTALEDDAYAAETRTTLVDVDARLEHRGWHSRSAYLKAPTFGGASWLSHSSLLAGRAIDSHDLYETFLHSGDEQLVDRFRKAGYRNVLLAPGIRGPWPAGLALRFDRIVAAKDVDYRGQGFGWWHIPDQYSLEWLNKFEIAVPERQPLFVVFPTIMSHFPFGPVPPYLKDWDPFTSQTQFDEDVVARMITLGNAFSDNAQDAYLRVMLYNLKTVSGFIYNRAPDSAIIIAIGDHQPPAVISGKNAQWDVPIHVIARDANLLDAFEHKGFVEGMLPQGMSVGRIDEITPIILEALEKSEPTSIAEID